ncbi:ribonuclease R [Pelotalea chapellei]|uniref:Ribonuclease R n=1 Tax=Pelotalea chapellei TaxID=44671 RepID=A0ABS5U649_9BACT|nr:ribonuclease R [Pelotalea chapellei]MBT1071133.1 ribonuclease R [Pelotalea chapellei]
MKPLSKKHILALLKAQEGPLHFAGLLREFGGRHVKHELKRTLDDMAGDGEIVRLRGNSYALATAAVSVRGKLSAHRDGYGFVTPEGGGEDIFIPQRQMKSAMHGDTVEVRAERSRMGGGKQEGRILSVAERATTRIVGRYEETRRGAIVIPEEQRLNMVISIPPKGRGLAEDGHQVVAEITSYPIGGRPTEGRIVEVLGWPDDPEVEVQSAIRRFDLPHVFGKDTLAEAESIAETVAETELKDRVDLRKMQTVTIDGETARDFDDAVSLRREGNNFRLWVSIADVSHYVKPGSPLDRDAYLRGTSVYFPDRCIPMLPERLSNGICSLNPQVDRLTMTAEMLFDRSGAVLESSFYPSIIKSTARLTYTLVKQIIVDDNREVANKHRPLVPMLLEMKELALILQAMRKKRGSIDFDLPEPEIIIGLTGQTENIIRAERNLAHQLIEEFMLAANEAVATFVTGKNIPFLYRIHENPDPAKLVNFQEFVYGFGYEFPLVDERVNPADLQRLLVQAEGRPEERMINYALLRCMKQARYAAENLHHFGLASDCYCHFTSPIRRYPDLVVHRILRATLALDAQKESKAAERELARATENLGVIGEHTSKRERTAMEAERDIVELKKIQFMQQHLGEEFDGFITGVTAFGFFTELEELFVEGLVHVSMLEDDVYTYMEKQHSLVGRTRRQVYRIGDAVRVKVAAVVPATRRIEFALVGHTASVTPTRPAGDNGMPDEYPRIPIRGKRLAGVQRKQTAPSTTGKPKRTGSGKGGSGTPKSGGRRRR